MVRPFTSIFHRTHLHLLPLWPRHSTSLPHLSPTSGRVCVCVCVCRARIMTALIRDVPNGWSCSVKAERKREGERGRKKKKKRERERAGPERGALCCYPPHRISQSNIHLGCRPPAPRTLSKTNLPPRFYRLSLLRSSSPPANPTTFLPSFLHHPAFQISGWFTNPQAAVFGKSRQQIKREKKSSIYEWRMQMLPCGAGGVAEWWEATGSGLHSRHVSTTHGRTLDWWVKSTLQRRGNVSAERRPPAVSFMLSLPPRLAVFPSRPVRPLQTLNRPKMLQRDCSQNQMDEAT